MRRGISEVVSATLLLAVMAAVSFYALGNSVTSAGIYESSISEALEQRGMRSQELLAVITKDTSHNMIALELLNYGTGTLLVDAVLVDGVMVPFKLLNTNGDDLSGLVEPRQITTLQVEGTGNTLHIITGSKNVISMSL